MAQLSFRCLGYNSNSLDSEPLNVLLSEQTEVLYAVAGGVRHGFRAAYLE